MSTYWIPLSETVDPRDRKSNDNHDAQGRFASGGGGGGGSGGHPTDRFGNELNGDGSVRVSSDRTPAENSARRAEAIAVATQQAAAADAGFHAAGIQARAHADAAAAADLAAAAAQAAYSKNPSSSNHEAASAAHSAAREARDTQRASGRAHHEAALRSIEAHDQLDARTGRGAWSATKP